MRVPVRAAEIRGCLSRQLPHSAEYEAGSDVFVAKIRSLTMQYGAIRRARGDGNCFFRSFIFALFEHLLGTQDYDARYR